MGPAGAVCGRLAVYSARAAVMMAMEQPHKMFPFCGFPSGSHCSGRPSRPSAKVLPPAKRLYGASAVPIFDGAPGLLHGPRSVKRRAPLGPAGAVCGRLAVYSARAAVMMAMEQPHKMFPFCGFPSGSHCSGRPSRPSAKVLPPAKRLYGASAVPIFDGAPGLLHGPRSVKRRAPLGPAGAVCGRLAVYSARAAVMMAME